MAYLLTTTVNVSCENSLIANLPVQSTCQISQNSVGLSERRI